MNTIHLIYYDLYLVRKLYNGYRDLLDHLLFCRSQNMPDNGYQ